MSRKVGILEIKGDDYRMIPIELKSVRPFLMEDIALSDLDLVTFTISLTMLITSLFFLVSLCRCVAVCNVHGARYVMQDPGNLDEVERRLIEKV